jgi:hypothetical protein
MPSSPWASAMAARKLGSADGPDAPRPPSDKSFTSSHDKRRDRPIESRQNELDDGRRKRDEDGDRQETW